MKPKTDDASAIGQPAEASKNTHGGGVSDENHTTTPSPIRVVHCMREPYDVYIGWESAYPGVNGPTGTRGEKRSKWRNRFKIDTDGTREEVIQKYEAWIKQQPELMADLPELIGKTLGCWCHPKACHGDVLARLVLDMLAMRGGK